MTIVFIRLFFILLGSITGYYVGSLLGDFSTKAAIIGFITGFFLSVSVIFL